MYEPGLQERMKNAVPIGVWFMVATPPVCADVGRLGMLRLLSTEPSAELRSHSIRSSEGGAGHRPLVQGITSARWTSWKFCFRTAAALNCAPSEPEVPRPARGLDENFAAPTLTGSQAMATV